MLKLPTLLFQILFIIFIIMSCYYPTIFAPFNSVDDEKMINYLLNINSFSIKDIFLPHSSAQYYRPLLFLTFIVDSFLWGLVESFMHLENILIHIGNSLMVFCLTRQTLYSSSNYQQSHTYAPLVTALMFGLHPIATEPVNWISGRTDLLASFFVLLSFSLFLVVVKQDSPAIKFLNGKERKENCLSRTYFFCYAIGILGAMSLLAGCLSKETALFILPIILAWCLFPPPTLTKPHVEIKWSLPSRLRFFLFNVYFCAGAAYLFLRWQALSGGDKIITSAVKLAIPTGNAESIGIFNIARIATKSAGFYFKKLIIPVPLNFGITSISPHYFWLGLLVLCCIAWCIYKRDTISYIFLAAFMLTTPAFFLPILRITWTPIAERYVYMASAPFLIGITALYIKYYKNIISARLVTFIFVLVSTCATVITVKRNIVWQDNCALFADTLIKSPDFAAAKNELAIALRNKGEYEKSDQLLLSNTNNDSHRPTLLNKIKVHANNNEFEKAYRMLLERSSQGVAEDKESLDLRNFINDHRLELASSNMIKHEINTEILATMHKLFEVTGDPFYIYRSGLVLLRLGQRQDAKIAFEKAWQDSSPKSHYHEAAKKLAERL